MHAHIRIFNNVLLFKHTILLGFLYNNSKINKIVRILISVGTA